MATSDNLSGENMNSGQNMGCRVNISESKPRRPCSLSLPHSISLPEKENLQNDALNGAIHGHTNKSSSHERAGISDPGSGNTRVFQNCMTLHCRKLFTLESEVNALESDGCATYSNNLYKYSTEYSFQQQGNSNRTKNNTLRYAENPWSLCCSKCTVNTTAHNHNIKHLVCFGTVRDDKTTTSDYGLQICRGNEDALILMDCEEQDWADENDCDGFALKKETFEEYECYDYVPNIILNQNQTDYISDSSCNSSDGVLVHFSTIYNKTNNAVPAAPYDLDSPVKLAQGSGSLHQDVTFKSIPCWSPCGVDTNCNIYQGDCNDLSPNVSDTTVCQGQLTAYTNDYYKLVTCDHSSQSAASPLTSCSEAQSYGSMTPPIEYFLFGKPETEDGEVMEVNQMDFQADMDAELKRSKRTRKISKGIDETKANSKTLHDHYKETEPNNHEQTSATLISQSWNMKTCHFSPKQEVLHCVLSGPSQISVFSHVPKQHETSFAEIVCYKKRERSPSVLKYNKEVEHSQFSQKISPTPRNVSCNVILITSKAEKESGSSGSSETASIPPRGDPEARLELLHYTKLQRPTSLPIQPFVLQPPLEKQSSNQALGSLISHYMRHKHVTSKITDLPRHLILSPLDDFSTNHLDVASCTDTFTPTPTEPYIRPHWAPDTPIFFHSHLDLKYGSTTNVEPNLPDKSPGANHTYLSNRNCPIIKQCLTCQDPKIPHNHLQSFLDKQAGSHQTLPKCLAPEPRTQEDPVCPHYNLSPAITSVTSLTSGTSLTLPGSGQSNSDAVQDHTNEKLNISGLPYFLGKEHRHGDSSSLTDGPPEELCSSPYPSTQILPIDLLQRKDMLKSLNAAVDMITAHFSSCTDPNEKVRLGNGSLCPRITQLVLDQLCPAFRNIVKDGLRPFKLDLIVGQRINKPWSVVEASTHPGPSTRMLHSLVSVVKKCSKLTNHSMRFNAFFLGLLNLSALESWFQHLHTCIDVIAEYYHPWAFLALSQDQAYQFLFQELLLQLQSLSELPFDLHLLSESRRQEQKSRFLTLSFLKMPNRQTSDGQPERSHLKDVPEPIPPSQTEIHPSCSTNIHKIIPCCAETVSKPYTRELEQEPVSSVCSKKKSAGWWLSQTPITEHMAEPERSFIIPHERNNERLMDTRKEEFSQRTNEVKAPKEIHWARLFGSVIGDPVAVEKLNQRVRPPSEWLQLGASKIDQLAQCVWSKEMSRTLCQLQQRPKLKY